MDLVSVVEKIRIYLVRFPDNYYNLLFEPSKFFSSVNELCFSRRHDLIASAFSFSFICLIIGSAVAGYMNLSGGPKLFDAQAIIFVLFFWCITAVILHPFLKMFRATGDISGTIVVVIFSTSALHILWIPIFAVISNIVTETKVILTYDYAISYSISFERGGDFGRAWGEADALAENFLGIFTESYVIEEEPDKEGTILPPAQPPDEARITNHEYLEYLSSIPENRVPAADAPFPKPTRNEEAFVPQEKSYIITYVSVIYFFSHVYYFGVGFSRVHGKSRFYWISLAIIVPSILLFSTIIIALIVFFGI